MVVEAARQISLTAAADVAIRRFVEMDSGGGGKVSQVGTIGNIAVGVAMEAADVSEEQDRIPVALLDGSKLEVEAGAAIDVSAAAVPVMSDASGRAIAATATNNILGHALTSADAAGEVVTIIATFGGVL